MAAIELERETRDLRPALTQSQPRNSAAPPVGQAAGLTGRNLERRYARRHIVDRRGQRGRERRIGLAQEDERQVELVGRYPARLGKGGPQRARGQQQHASAAWSGSGAATKSRQASGR